MSATNVPRRMRLICGFVLALAWPVVVVAEVNNARFESCRAQLKQLHKLEVLYGMQWHAPAEPRVIVGPTFSRLPIDGKESFVAVVNCFLMVGDADKCVNFDTLDWQTGKAVGRFENCRFKMK